MLYYIAPYKTKCKNNFYRFSHTQQNTYRDIHILFGIHYLTKLFIYLKYRYKIYKFYSLLKTIPTLEDLGEK